MGTIATTGEKPGMSGTKPKQRYGGYKNPADYLRYMREYRATHRKQLADQEKARREKDPAGHAEWARDYRKRNRDAINERRANSRKIGGLITPAEYDVLLTSQGGACAICGVIEGTRKAPDGHKKRRNFCVDHDHTTMEVRGLLCAHCNAGLGYFKDDPARLSAAIKYLGAKGSDLAGFGPPLLSGVRAHNGRNRNADDTGSEACSGMVARIGCADHGTPGSSR